MSNFQTLRRMSQIVATGGLNDNYNLIESVIPVFRHAIINIHIFEKLTLKMVLSEVRNTTFVST